MRREYFWALITLVIAILLAYILIVATEERAPAMVQVDCMDPTEREKIREIVLDGIDQGLREQIQHLFEVWTKDLSDQPRRALVGTNNAVNAHVRARKNALAWDPPKC